MLTPAGWFESRRLPGSGAGPSPDRLVLGLGGHLGRHHVVLAALAETPGVPRPPPAFASPLGQGVATPCGRLFKPSCGRPHLRILDVDEAKYAAGMDGRHALLIIGFESAGRSAGGQHARRGGAGPRSRRLGGRLRSAGGRRQRRPHRPRGRGGRVAQRLRRRERRPHQWARPLDRHLRDRGDLGSVAGVRCAGARRGGRRVAGSSWRRARACPAVSRTSIRTGRHRTTPSAAPCRAGRKRSAGKRSRTSPRTRWWRRAAP